MTTTIVQAQQHRTPSRRSKRAERIFFTGMAAVMLVTVVAGFAPTYFLRSSIGASLGLGDRVFTPLVHLHATVFSIWILLFMVQTGLVAARRTAWHRKLGAASLIAAVAVILIGFETAITSAKEGRFPVGWLNAEAFLFLSLATVALFAGFFVAGFANRRRSDWHKRFMLLATLSMAQPALARILRFWGPEWLPSGSGGSLLVFNLYWLALVAFDLWQRGRLHPATIWGSVVLLAAWPLRLTIGNTDVWQNIGHHLLR